jgi:hypothetical protein
MKLSIKTMGYLLFVFTFLCIQNVEAGFSNNGRMQSKNLNLNIGGTLDNNGELIGTESATIVCDTISGKGLLSSPQISLKAKVFAYTGTIDCAGKCTIVTASAFNEGMFKRTGGGEFVIVVDPNLGQNSPKKSFNYSITDELEVEVD